MCYPCVVLTEAPLAVALGFIAIVAGMLALALWGAARAARRVGPGAVQGVRIAGVGLVGWLALTGVLAERGFFDDFQSLPPRMLLALGLPLLTLLALTFSHRIAPLLAAVPPGWLVAAQTFRIPVEIVLWQLAVAGVMPDAADLPRAQRGHPGRPHRAGGGLCLLRPACVARAGRGLVELGRHRHPPERGGARAALGADPVADLSRRIRPRPSSPTGRTSGCPRSWCHWPGCSTRLSLRQLRSRR